MACNHDLQAEGNSDILGPSPCPSCGSGSHDDFKNCTAHPSEDCPWVFAQFKQEKVMADPKLIKIDVKGVEEWREYDFGGRVYRIERPVSVEFKKDSTTHRVTDSDGVVHCVPAPGQMGCALRWRGAVIA
jgi:hypothetical protein